MNTAASCLSGHFWFLEGVSFAWFLCSKTLSCINRKVHLDNGLLLTILVLRAQDSRLPGCCSHVVSFTCPFHVPNLGIGLLRLRFSVGKRGGVRGLVNIASCCRKRNATFATYKGEASRMLPRLRSGDVAIAADRLLRWWCLQGCG